MQPSSGIKAWQWVVTIIIIIALIVVAFMVFGNKKAAPASTTETQSTTDNSTTAVNRIIMSDQNPGNVVNVSSVQVSKPSWLAIQADNNGVPGAVLGSAKFDTGINPGRITLSSPMVDGKTYYAVLYTYDGAKFDIKSATPVKDSSGNVIMRPFKASANADLNIKG